MSVGAWRALHVLIAVAVLGSCTRDTGPPSDPRDVIVLRWIKAYPGESRSDVQKGLLWGLSLLGADVPSGRRVVTWRGDRVTLDLARAGVLEGTQGAWRELVAAMKASGEYQVHGAIDAGRFMSLTLGSSYHYFVLTGAVPEYQASRNRWRFDEKKAAIEKSSVAFGSRLIELSVAEQANQIAALAFEGTGSLAQGTFVPREIEIIDMMPNGQFRFALYDMAGRLKSGATPELTTAGKPAKCMWCHETGLQSTFIEFATIPGFYGRKEFDALIDARRKLLGEYRVGLAMQIDYRDLREHAYPEYLYRSFEGPSLERLAGEWQMPVERVAELVRGKPTHEHDEEPMLGQKAYRREDVEALAPYQALAAPRSVRELSNNEPAIIRPGVAPTNP